MKIVLGSGSPRRKKILSEMGYEFEVVPADIDEKVIRKDDPKELTLAVADAKSESLSKKLDQGTILITADSVVVFEGKILEKPESKEEARKVLKNYKNKPVEVVTGVVVINLETGIKARGTDSATIYFKPFSDELINKFVDSGKTFEHAGSFGAVDELFTPFISRVVGSMTSIAGFPKKLVEKLIDQVKE